MIKSNLIFFNGVIYSANNHNHCYSAMAIKDGIITHIGTDESVLSQQTPDTQLIDLQQQFMMPGLIDAHLHPFWGTSQSLSCDLKHQALSKQAVLTRIADYTQNYLKEYSDGWIVVRGWMQPDMLPTDTPLINEDLNGISTTLPIIVFSNDCHVLVCNDLALASFKTVSISDNARATGVLEDGPAMQAFDEITRYSQDYALKVARKAQSLLNQEGITTVMDARVDDVTLRAFQTLADADDLTLRFFGAKEIPAKTFASLEMIPQAIADTQAFMTAFSAPQMAMKPATTVTHIKFFIDGVLQEPLHTALLRQPYHLADPAQQNRTGDCYYDQTLLTALLAQTNPLGWHPHMHTVGDAGIDFALDCIEGAQQISPNEQVRAGFAHNELTAKDHYARFKQLNVIATQSIQWSAMDQATHDAYTQILGDERMQYFECAGKFYDAGVKVAYGSDWPIDPLNIWQHLESGMNRQTQDDDFKHDNDRDLTLLEVLRSATIDAAYMLSQEDVIGSLEPGKFADCIVLNHNPFTLNSKQIHMIKAEQVFVGGKKIKI